MHLLDQNKLIGCKIFGNIVSAHENVLSVDPERLYEIILIPGQTPKGILVRLKRQEEKTILVEIPDEIRNCNYEKCCGFLLENNLNLIVREEGFEKLRNCKLVLEKFPHSEQLLINVLPFIQCRCNGIDYEIELNPYDLSTSSVETIDSSSNETKKIYLNLDELINVNLSDLKKILPKLKLHNFRIENCCDQLTLYLNDALKEYASSLGKPTKYQNFRESKTTVPYHFLPDEINKKTEIISEVFPKSEKAKEKASSHLRLTGPDHKPNFFGRLWKLFSK